MRLSTSTNIVSERPDGTLYSVEKTLAVAHSAGFDRFDMSFYEWNFPGSPFWSEQWEEWICSIADCAARLGVRFGQCHGHTYSFLSPALSAEEREHQELLVDRSLRCCSILGAQVFVTHPDTAWGSDRVMRYSKHKNLEYLKGLLDRALNVNLEIAVENMCDYSILPKRKFYVLPEEIADFIDEFRDPRLGVCWDFEHGDILEFDQAKVVAFLGHRIKATHVSDTASKTYEPYMHILPFMGEIKWRPITDALREINYQGDLSLEAHNFAKKIPEDLIPAAIKYAYTVGKYLLAGN